MNQVNFDALKNIKAPQDWLDKAAAIPGTCVQEKRAFPIYRVAAVASLVLVTVIGLLLFFFYGNNKPIEIRPSSTETTVTATETPGLSPELSPTLTIEAILPTTPREAPTDEHGQPVTEVIPTEKRNSSATEPTSVSPSQAATEHKPNPTQNAVAPTEESPAPTQAPLPTEPPIPTENPGEIVAGSICFTAVFPASLIEEGEPIYCEYWEQGLSSIENNGSEDDGQAQYTVMDNGMVYAVYEPNEPIPAGSVTYEYRFYQNGKLLASGSQAV